MATEKGVTKMKLLHISCRCVKVLVAFMKSQRFVEHSSHLPSAYNSRFAFFLQESGRRSLGYDEKYVIGDRKSQRRRP